MNVMDRKNLVLYFENVTMSDGYEQMADYCENVFNAFARNDPKAAHILMKGLARAWEDGYRKSERDYEKGM